MPVSDKYDTYIIKFLGQAMDKEPTKPENTLLMVGSSPATGMNLQHPEFY